MGTNELSAPADTTDPLDVMAKALLGFGHPLRIRLLALLEYEHAPKDLADVIGAPLGVTSYHVRMLRDYGLAEETRTEAKRGALQHFYIRSNVADELMGLVGFRFFGVPKRGVGRNDERRLEELRAWARLPDALVVG